MQENNEKNLPERYQTGSTTPPKNRSSLIAILLVLVILLSGIVSILGLMNIHLFRTLIHQQEEGNALAFDSQPTEPIAMAQYLPTQQPLAGRTAIGIFARDISAFDADFYQIPSGVYVTGLYRDCDAYRQGLRPGDIILNFDRTPTPDCNTLRGLLDTRHPGERATLTIYRSGSQLEISVILYEDED